MANAWGDFPMKLRFRQRQFRRRIAIDERRLRRIRDKHDRWYDIAFIRNVEAMIAVDRNTHWVP